MSREVVIPTVEETLALQAARVRHLESLEHGIEPFSAHPNNPCARVYRATDQSIPNNVVTGLNFSNERFDTDNIWVLGVPSRLTCQTAGKYQITGQMKFLFHGTGYRWLSIRLNAGPYIAQLTKSPVIAANTDTYLDLTTLYDLSVADFLQLNVYQNSGGALNVVAAPNYGPEFMMARVG